MQTRLTKRPESVDLADTDDLERPPLQYEVTYTVPGDDEPTTTVTDAQGVTELVRRAAATGTRVHVRPVPDAGAPTNQ
jgi:hypothetical protein